MSDELGLTMFLEDSSILLDTVLKNIKDFQIHQINENRKVFGEYHHLFPVLRNYPTKFFNYTRMKIETFDYLLVKIQNCLIKSWCNYHQQPILPEERLVVTLRFLATGMSYTDLAFSFRMGRSTINVIIKEVMETLWRVLYPIHMPIPSREKLIKISEDFYSKYQFPHCIGAIDCQHVRIKQPPHSGSKYYNYKKFFSIVLQAVVDSDCKFIAIDVGGYGRQSDGSTLYGSTFYAALKTKKIIIPETDALPNSDIILPYFFIGDGAYPLMENLMKPYPGMDLPVYAQTFNKRLSRARVTVERAFGLLGQKWKIFNKKIEQLPETVNLIVKCSCVLHNVILDQKESINNNYENNFNPGNRQVFVEDESETNFIAGYGKEVRYELTKWILQNPVN